MAGALAVTSIVFVSPDPLFWLAGLSLGETVQDTFAHSGQTTCGVNVTQLCLHAGLVIGSAVCMAGVAVGMLLPFLIGRRLFTHRIQACVCHR